MSSNHSPVLIDVSRLVWRARGCKLPTGIDRTCMAYIAHYRRQAQAVVQSGRLTRVMPFDFSQMLFDLLLSPWQEARPALSRMLLCSLLTHLPMRTLAGQLYFNVGHTGLDRTSHSDWLRRSRVRPIYFVHDLIPLTHPEYCRPNEPQKHLRRMTTLLRYGAGVIANSRDTLNELAVFTGLQKALDMPPGVVAPLGAGHDREKRTLEIDHALPGRSYFVMVGTIEGRKNHLLILNVWAEMARQMGARCPQLVIIGQRGWESEQVVDMLERCEAIRGHVIELSACDDVRLAAYVKGARALLFPTFVEGYGLPLVEALVAGTPVIASNLPVFRELAGTIPDYLSPIDGLGWRAMIEDYAAPDSRARAYQLARMAGWTAPTWKAHFALVDHWLGSVVGTDGA